MRGTKVVATFDEKDMELHDQLVWWAEEEDRTPNKMLVVLAREAIAARNAEHVRRANLRKRSKS